MDEDYPERTKSESSSIPPPPGVDYDETRRHYKYESRSRSKEYDRERDRSRHDRGRESRFDREDYSRPLGDDRRSYYSDMDYRDSKDSGSDTSRSRDLERSRNKESDSSRSRNKDSEKESRSEREGRHERKSYRDRSRERDRSRDRDRKDRTRDRERDRGRTDAEVDCRDDIPNNTIVIKGMPPNVTEEDIRNEINRYTLYPLDVVLKRNKITGESRGFAFVEFRMLSDAVRWKELTQGVLYFGQVRSTLHYSVPREAPDRRLDWCCLKCGVNNFRKRDFCFKCSAPREEADVASLGGEGFEEVSKSPSSTLLFRNLDILTTEERVLSMLGQITVLPIKNLKVAKDSLTSTSRGFAYVELHSVSEAMQLHDLLLSMAGNFFVDGRRVTVSYSRKPLSLMNSTASANAASAALAAAQWTNQDASYNQSQNVFSDSTIRGRHMESVQSLNAGVCNNYEKKATPDVSTYQYDETSGYYYDSTTGYYYDANSQYYYNSVTQQYLYWDLEKQAYTVVPTANNGVASSTAVIAAPATKGAEVVISSPPVIAHAPVLNKKEDEKPKDKINPQDKVKIAKKVAKDMEKWAKTLNQKKFNNKTIHNFTPKPAPVEQPPKAPETSSPSVSKSDLMLMETLKKVDMVLSNGKLVFSAENKDTPASALVAEYGGESDSEIEAEFQDEGTKAVELLKCEEAKLIDWTKLACLLCKRQFPTKDVLSKHVQISDLHKQNVSMLKLTKLTPKQLQELEKKESGYRDRARERREKFGQPDLPPPSRLKTKYMKERKEAFQPPPEQPAEAIGSDNIGNKMLKAMGWSEGQGLGKTGQGMSGIIEVQRRVKSAGLGMKGAQYGAGASDSYKDAVRKSMQARYNEIA